MKTDFSEEDHVFWVFRRKGSVARRRKRIIGQMMRSFWQKEDEGDET